MAKQRIRDELAQVMKQSAEPRPDERVFWEMRVPMDSTEPTAGQYARREARRALRVTGGPSLRVVLVQYADGVADLVLVAFRSVLPQRELVQLAGALTGGQPAPSWERSVERTTQVVATDSQPGPEWGLGDPGRGGVTGEVQFVVKASPGRADASLLAAAAAVVLGRYDADEAPQVGVLNLDGLRREALVKYVLTLDEEQPAGRLLAQFGHAPESIAGPPAESGTCPAIPVGIVFGQAIDGHRYLPCLAPVFPVTLYAERRTDGSLDGTCWYDEGLVDPRIARSFAEQVAYVANQLTDLGSRAEEIPLSAVGLMPPEKAADIIQLGVTDPVPPEVGAAIPRTIHGRFEGIARRQPDAVAATDGATELTYRQLNERADCMADGLRSLGVARGSVVGVCLERNVTLVVTLLAVLKSGCSYVPMDVKYPEERLRYTTTNAGAQVVVADADAFPDVNGVRTVSADDLLALGAGGRVLGPVPQDAGESPAYVIYTSGSTGRPKGVVVPHRNVLALVEGTEQDLALGAADVWTLFHSSAFDFSVWETWGCLLTGGRLVVVPFWVTRDTTEFRELLVEQRVTVLSQTPSAFLPLIEADREASAELAVRLVVFGGEPLDTRRLMPWFARHPHTGCRLVNMFGITETTVHVTAETVTPETALLGSRSVGSALPGWAVSVRNSKGGILPLGAAGEICVGGEGIASHYLGQPELTAERFVIDPVSGERIYRSGDKGRMRPDGRLEHLGRIDSQVKVRGHRIELDEIRSVLLGSPLASGAAVVLHRDASGDVASDRLDAYVMLRPGATVAQLMVHAKQLLPDYMVPATVTVVDMIPLTINGKLDVARLPEPATAQATEEAQPWSASIGPTGYGAADDLESELLALWSRHLNTPVGRDDNFFEMGGNSLLVVRVLAEVRQMGMPRIAMRDFYSNSSAGQFVELVRGLRDAPVDVGGAR
ncbi:non-ribosomal peptide synthetase [Streptomyces diacarni]|uniref:non-ribosomal peptide synthetase n=1 Tax=Streptomyces diacarni TaxID=2800381 RepID=UPI0033D76CBC